MKNAKPEELEQYYTAEYCSDTVPPVDTVLPSSAHMRWHKRTGTTNCAKGVAENRAYARMKSWGTLEGYEYPVDYSEYYTADYCSETIPPLDEIKPQTTHSHWHQKNRTQNCLRGRAESAARRHLYRKKTLDGWKYNPRDYSKIPPPPRKPLPPKKKPLPKVMPKGRVCETDGCITRLSVYNKQNVCNYHIGPRF